MMFSGLTPGTHTFEAVGVDRRGSKGPTPAIFSWDVLTSQDAAHKLIDRIQEHISDNVLSSHQGNTLIAKLQAAMDRLDAHASGSPAGELNSFLVFVDAYVRGHILAPEQGQQLSLSAWRILHAIRGAEEKSAARTQTERSYGIDAR